MEGRAGRDVLELQDGPGLVDAQRAGRAEGPRRLDPLAVEQRAVAAAEILDPPDAGLGMDARVLARDERVVVADPAIGAAADEEPVAKEDRTTALGIGPADDDAARAPSPPNIVGIVESVSKSDAPSVG